MRYLVWCPDYGETAEDGVTIEAAVDAGDAAETWAERSDRESAGYGIVGGDGVTVVVRSQGLEESFEVTGESVPRYHAQPVREVAP